MSNETWVHYSGEPTPITPFYATQAQDISGLGKPHWSFKPHGLWITPENQDNNWHDWCTSESFRLEELKYIHDVKLAKHANILRISTVGELDAFSEEYARDLFEGKGPAGFSDGLPLASYMACDWGLLAGRYSGVIISPYQWTRRLDMGKSSWYYAWDCASGCIWDDKAIESITLRPLMITGSQEIQSHDQEGPRGRTLAVDDISRA